MRRRIAPPRLAVALVGCGKTKLQLAPGATAPARDLYSPGVLFPRSLELAQHHHGERVHVVSAEHRLVDLDTPLEWYEKRMADLPREERKAWGEDVIAALQGRYPGQYVELTVYASKPYITPLLAALPAGWKLNDPMKGLEIGDRKKWLREQLEALSARAETEKPWSFETWLADAQAGRGGYEVKDDAPAWPEDGWSFHFASGTNHHGEVRGLALSGLHVGVTVAYLPRVIEELGLYAGADLQVFVDSGAYSEVAPGEGGEGLQDVKPLGEAHWQMVMKRYRELAVLMPGQVRLVAPDKVGDQKATLARLKKYAPQLRELRQLGARIIVAIQRGDLPMVDFDAEVVEVLGFSDFIRGIPATAKAGFNLGEFELYLSRLPIFDGAALQVPAIHLLGMGPRSPGFEAARALVRLYLPDGELSSDSVERRARVGRTNGPGGGPRSLTAAEDALNAAALSEGRELGAEELKAQSFVRVFHGENAHRVERARAGGWYDAELEDGPCASAPSRVT